MALALALLVGTALGVVPRVAGFFGAGALSLIAMLSLTSAWLRSGTWGALRGHGTWAVWRLGWRNTAYRPARSVLCIALIAFATFVIVAVEAFKRDESATLLDRHSGGGGYPLLVETLLPVVHDLNDPAGRDAMNLPAGAALQNVRFDRFRVRPGDDASCLNLYQPKNPRIMAATQDFINSGRFAFHSSLAATPEERANPWLLLNRELDNGAVPVIADANSMTYVLHMKLGDELVLPGSSERPVRLRLVAALSDSIFQGELLMAEQPFVLRFPEWEGYRFFLADAPLRQTAEVTELLESRLTDFGVDVASTSGRLAGFHRVEYTYLSTFQMLGGLGLVLGHARARGDPPSERARTPARACTAARARLHAIGFSDDGRGRERVSAGRRADHRHVLRAGCHRAGVSRSRRPIADSHAGAAAARRVGNRASCVGGRHHRGPAVAVVVGITYGVGPARLVDAVYRH